MSCLRAPRITTPCDVCENTRIRDSDRAGKSKWNLSALSPPPTSVAPRRFLSTANSDDRGNVHRRTTANHTRPRNDSQGRFNQIECGRPAIVHHLGQTTHIIVCCQREDTYNSPRRRMGIQSSDNNTRYAGIVILVSLLHRVRRDQVRIE